MKINDVNGKFINLSNSDKKLFEQYVRYGTIKSGLQLYYKKAKDLYYFYFWNNQSGIKDEYEVLTNEEAEEFLEDKILKLNEKRKAVLLLK